ncbi:MAG: hypothetical protein LBF41_01070 [Deltaproteobacteria bacterium]|jgi:hypothetical protein|nr:hypothetical protein [Deltaproteobacteria bacterium]
MRLTFEIKRTGESRGTFRPLGKEEWLRSKRAVQTLSLARENKEMSHGDCLRACEAILKENPLDLNALSLLTDLSISSANRGDGAFPDLKTHFRPFMELMGNFGGKLDTGDDGSITFLSCHYALILDFVRSERWEEALENSLCHKLWNPEGARDVETFIGNLQLLLQLHDDAEYTLGSPDIPMPDENAYGLALSQFLLKKTRPAAETLRKAFLTQPYVAEIIANGLANPPALWNFPDNEAIYFNALSYANLYLGEKIWEGREDALSFISWVHHHPKTMRERADALTLLRETLYLKNDEKPERDKLLARYYLVADTPNPDLLESVLKPIRRGGKNHRPWEFFGRDGRAKTAADPENPRPAPGDWRTPGPENFKKSREIAETGKTRGMTTDAEIPPEGDEPAPGAGNVNVPGADNGAIGETGRKAAGDRPEAVLEKRSGIGDNAPRSPNRAETGRRTGADRTPPGILLNSVLRSPIGTVSAMTRKPKDKNHSGSQNPGDEKTSAKNDGDASEKKARNASDARNDPEDPGPGERFRDFPDGPDESCGDCADCENFDECSEAPAKEDVECVECDECDIEGFCTIPTTPKIPPYRH